MEAYEQQALVGCGSCSRVWRVQDKRSGHLYAMKRILLELVPEELEHIVEEVRTLAHLNHPNIVPLHDCITIGRELCLVHPYYSHGSLAELRMLRLLSEEQICVIAAQILDGLVYIHRRRLAHRDLTNSNCMLQGDGSVILVDFGIAAKVEAARHTVVGIPAWLAPEMLSGQSESNLSRCDDMFSPAGYRTTVDLYGLGVSLVELADGTIDRLKYWRDGNIKTHGNGPPKCASSSSTAADGSAHDSAPAGGSSSGMNSSSVNNLERTWSQQFVNLVKWCLEADPTRRCTAVQARSHPFFSSIATDAALTAAKTRVMRAPVEFSTSASAESERSKRLQKLVSLAKTRENFVNGSFHFSFGEISWALVGDMPKGVPRVGDRISAAAARQYDDRDVDRILRAGGGGASSGPSAGHTRSKSAQNLNGSNPQRIDRDSAVASYLQRDPATASLLFASDTTVGRNSGVNGRSTAGDKQLFSACSSSAMSALLLESLRPPSGASVQESRFLHELEEHFSVVLAPPAAPTSLMRESPMRNRRRDGDRPTTNTDGRTSDSRQYFVDLRRVGDDGNVCSSPSAAAMNFTNDAYSVTTAPISSGDVGLRTVSLLAGYLYHQQLQCTSSVPAAKVIPKGSQRQFAKLPQNTPTMLEGAADCPDPGAVMFNMWRQKHLTS